MSTDASSASPLPFDAAALFAQSKDAYVVYDTEHRFVYVNDAACLLLGYERAVLVGRTPSEVFGGRASVFEQCVDRAVTTRDAVHVVHKLRAGAGKVVYLDTSYAAVLDAQGAVGFVAAVGRDMTDTSMRWRELEDTVARRTRDLSQMESRFDALLKNLHVGVLIRGPQAELRFCNRRALELLGMTEAQLRDLAQPDPNWRMVDEQGNPLPLERYPTASAITSGEEITAMTVGVDRPRTRDRVWLLANVVLQRSPNGDIEQIVVTLSDVTEAQAATRALAEREETFRALAETITDVFWMTDPTEQSIVYVSPAYETVWGRSREDLFAKRFNFLDALPDEDRARVVAAMPLQAAGEYDIDYRVNRPDGTVRWVRDRAYPVKDGAGNVLRVVGLVTDVTEQRETSELIRRQADALRELSTPLVPIGDGVLAMPIVGVLDSARARQVLETLLEGIVRHAAEVVILDVTGVGVVDTQVASALVAATQAAQLLGADVVLTGLRPDVAQTIVGLGIDFDGLVTRSTLAMGIRWALDERKRRKSALKKK